jgi:hypothetical protein
MINGISPYNNGNVDKAAILLDIFNTIVLTLIPTIFYDRIIHFK